MLKKIHRQFWKYSNFFLVPSEYVANMLFKLINLVLRTVLEKCEEKPSPLLMRSYILAVSDHFGLNSVYVFWIYSVF